MNTKTLTLRALILAPVLLIAAPAAASTPTDRCDTYIKAAEPIGWRIACVGDDIGSDTYGVTYLDYRIILIRRGLGEEQTRLTIAHENAHAEAENLFSPATKAWFTQRLGKTLWYDTNDYYGSPVEVWASSRARCQGAPLGGCRCRCSVRALMRSCRSGWSVWWCGCRLVWVWRVV